MTRLVEKVYVLLKLSKKKVMAVILLSVYVILFFEIGNDINLITSFKISMEEIEASDISVNVIQVNESNAEVYVAKPKTQFQRMAYALDLQTETVCNCSVSSIRNTKDIQEKHQLEIGRQSCMKKRFPKAIVVGMTKGGTSALMSFLEDHPMIAPRTHGPKDTRYFNYYYKSRSYSWYRNLMPCSFSHQVTVSKSTEYFFTPGVAERIREFDQSMKIIILLREPIARALSQYIMWSYQGKLKSSNVSFEEAVTKGFNKSIDRDSRLIAVSNYQRHIKAWLHNFNINQILILDGDNFVVKPADELNKLEEFLGVDRHFTQENFVFDKEKRHYCLTTLHGNIKCIETKTVLYHPVIKDDLRIKLEQFFTPRNKMFFQMIGKHYNWKSKY